MPDAIRDSQLNGRFDLRPLKPYPGDAAICEVAGGLPETWCDGVVEFIAMRNGENYHLCSRCANNVMAFAYGDGWLVRPIQERLGTPISELSGRPGHAGYEEFKRIAESWGYD